MLAEKCMIGCLGLSSLFATAFTGGVIEMANKGVDASQHVLLNGSVVAVIALLFIITFIGFIVALGMMLKSRTKADVLAASTAKEVAEQHRVMVAGLTEAQNERVRVMADKVDKLANTLHEMGAEQSRNIGMITEGHIRATAEVTRASTEQMQQFIHAEMETSKEIGNLVAILNSKPCVAGTILEALERTKVRVVTDEHKHSETTAQGKHP